MTAARGSEASSHRAAGAALVAGGNRGVRGGSVGPRAGWGTEPGSGGGGRARSVPARRHGEPRPREGHLQRTRRGAPGGVGGGREGPAFPGLRQPAAARGSGRRLGQAGGVGAFPALPWRGISVWPGRSAGEAALCCAGSRGALCSGSAPLGTGRVRGRLRAGTLRTKPGAEPCPVVPEPRAVWGLAWPWHGLCPLLLAQLRSLRAAVRSVGGGVRRVTAGGCVCVCKR